VAGARFRYDISAAMMSTHQRRHRKRDLLRAALAGGDFTGRLRRLARGLSAFVDSPRLAARFVRLHRAGVIEHIPTRWQLVGGIVDMLRFWVIPSADDYAEEQQETSLAFYQVVRFLAEPATVIDSIGLFSDRDVIVRHLMQVHHYNPAYDLQLLRMFDDGIDELERQLDEVLAGTHPRAATILTLVEEPGYPAQLRRYLPIWRRDGNARFDRDPAIVGDAERTFATVSVLVRYMNRLPATAAGVLRHFATTRTFPLALAEPRHITAATT
jgi:hypothetical protein